MLPRPVLLRPERADHTEHTRYTEHTEHTGHTGASTATIAGMASELNAGISDREDALAATLRCITSLAVRLVPAADCAGVVVCRRGRPEPVGPSDGAAAALDRLQVDLGQGPAVDVLRGVGAPVVEAYDLGAPQDRWPDFAPAARDRGVTAALAVALVPRDRPLGAVTVYVHDGAALPAGASDLLATLAVPAAMALHAARRVAGLDQAVESRDLIGQAKGVLMQRDGIGPDEAFGRLVAASQHTNLKLVDVARWLVDDAGRR